MKESRRVRTPWVSTAQTAVTIALGVAGAGISMYGTRLALGIPMGQGSLEGMRLKFLAWLLICVVSIPLAFVVAVRLVHGISTLVMALGGKSAWDEAAVSKDGTVLGTAPAAGADEHSGLRDVFDYVKLRGCLRFWKWQKD